LTLIATATQAKVTLRKAKAGVNVSWIELLITPVTATMSTAHKNGALFLLPQIAKLMTAFYAQTVVKSMYKGQQLVTSRV